MRAVDALDVAAREGGRRRGRAGAEEGVGLAISALEGRKPRYFMVYIIDISGLFKGTWAINLYYNIMVKVYIYIYSAVITPSFNKLKYDRTRVQPLRICAGRLTSNRASLRYSRPAPSRTLLHFSYSRPFLGMASLKAGSWLIVSVLIFL